MRKPLEAGRRGDRVLGDEERLVVRARLAGIEIGSELRAQLASYLSLLAHWNQRVNLAALGDPDKAVDRLIVEPLVAAAHVPPEASSLLDIGSGGGSPGIPLKLALPHLTLVLVEARGRKTAFLREVCRELDLRDVRVERARFEDLVGAGRLAGGMDVVTVRAVRIGSGDLELLQSFLRAGGQVLWFRGEADERMPAVRSFELAGHHRLVPALGSRLTLLRKV